MNKTKNGGLFISVLLISVVPALILSCALAVKGAFLTEAFTVAVKIVCAIGAALCAVIAARCAQDAADRKGLLLTLLKTAALYLAIFAVLYALTAAANMLVPKFTQNRTVRALPFYIGGVLQSIFLPAFLYRMVRPNPDKRVGIFRYLLCALLVIAAGCVLQAEEVLPLLIKKTVVYTKVTSAFVILVVKALLAALLLSAVIGLLKKNKGAAGPEKKASALAAAIPALIALTAVILSALAFRVSAYQRIKDDVDGLIAEGTDCLQKTAFDRAGFTFRRADNHRNGWLALLNGESAYYAYSDYRLDEDTTVLFLISEDSIDTAEETLKNSYSSLPVNAVLFELYAKERTNRPEFTGNYYQDTLAMLAANGIYTRPYPLVDDLNDRQKADLTEYFGSLDRIGALRKILDGISEYGHTGEWNSPYDLYELCEQYPDDFFINYYAAAYSAITVDDSFSPESVEAVIDNYLRIAETELDDDSLNMVRARAIDQYIQLGSYEKALAVAEKVKTASADEKENLDLIRLICYNRLDRSDECTALAAQMIAQGSTQPRVIFFAGVGAVKKGDRSAALDHFSSLCQLLKPGQSSDEVYEIEQHMLVLGQYIALADDSSWTDFTYSFYGDLTEEERMAFKKKDNLAYLYLEGIYNVFETEDKAAALAALDAVTDANASLSLAWYLKGAILQAQGDHAEAAKMLEKSLSLHDDVPAVMYTLANTYDALGRLEEAYRLSVRVYEKYSVVNHEKDWYGLGYHNTNLMNSLKDALDEQNGGEQP